MICLQKKKIKKREFFTVDSNISDQGIDFYLKKKSFSIRFPKEVWKDYPEENKQVILDNLTFALTCHLPCANKKRGVIYKTSMPCFKPFIFKSTVFDIPSTAAIDNKKTSEYMKRFFNARFFFSSYSPNLPRFDRPKNQNKKQKTAIILFSAGKESLLTLALCLELGIRPVPVYIDECDHNKYQEYETVHKNEIISTLKKEFGITVHTINNDLKDFQFYGYHDDMEFNNWGFGAMLTIFLLEVLPFAHHFNADYIFFGNEFSCDHVLMNDDGWKTNYVYDQSSEWTRHMDTITRMMTNNQTKAGSLVSPLFELALTKVLHERYPKLAKLQMSCFAVNEEGKENRWCCSCSKCARLFVFFKALGIDVKSVDIKKDMFYKKYSRLFSVFGSHDDMVGFDQSGLGSEEQQLAFLLAIDKNAQGPLIDEFKKASNYAELKKNIPYLKKKFFGIYDSVSIPGELKQKVLNIYRQELC